MSFVSAVVRILAREARRSSGVPRKTGSADRAADALQQIAWAETDRNMLGDPRRRR